MPKIKTSTLLLLGGAGLVGFFLYSQSQNNADDSEPSGSNGSGGTGNGLSVAAQAWLQELNPWLASVPWGAKMQTELLKQGSAAVQKMYVLVSQVWAQGGPDPFTVNANLQQVSRAQSLGAWFEQTYNKL